MQKILITTLISASFIFPSCKKQLDINRDPNNPPVENGTAQLLFPAAVLSSASTAGGELAIVGNIWSEFCTQDAYASQFRNIDAYNIGSTDLNTNYTEMYSGALNDYKSILEKSTAAQDWNFYLMATVMKAYTYQVLADLYDQVPYSEALLGATGLQPKFDDGYSIYEGLLNEIDTALGKDLSASTNSLPGASDLVFNGDMNKWIAFANTLKLKMYLRMVNAKPDEAESGIKALYASGATFLTGDASVSEFTEEPGKQNPFYAYNIYSLNTTTNLRASVTFLSWLKANNDPRIVSYYGSATATGINQGDYLSTDPAYQGAAVFVQHATDPVQFISGPESYFMQAEARERYFEGDQAKELYDAGVQSAFAFYGFDASSFLAVDGAYEYPSAGTPDEKIEAIITQKWASLPGSHSLEAFFERNRTGYPVSGTVYSTDPSYIPGQFVVSNTSVLGDNYPKRLVFPDVERSTNKNTPAAVPITTPVWWGK